MQGSGKRSLAYVAAAILVAGVLVSATLVLVPLSRPPTTVTETSLTTATETTTLTSVMTSTETTTSTSTTTTTETTTTTSEVTLPAGCLPYQSNGYSSGTLVAGTSSPAIICVQVYWFNSTSPIVLNATSLLQIEGCEGCGTTPGEGEQLPDAGANFTVAASVDQLTLGGPANAGEGTVLAYSITAKAGASGTYQLAVQGAQLGEDELWESGPNGNLVAGNGQPNYVPPGGTILPITISGGTSFTIPGVGYTVSAGILCYRIISLTNSTQ